MTQRLTQADVYTACTDIVTQGERPTALKLLNHLERGSLTTITKHLHSWSQTEEAQFLKTDSLPIKVELPEEFAKESDHFLKKTWALAKRIADEELEFKRDALKQVEQEAQTQVDEAFAFSEEQAVKIERLEENIIELEKKFDGECTAHKETQHLLAESEKVNIALSKDNEQLQHEIESLKSRIVALEESEKENEKASRALQKSHIAELKKKDAEIKSLDMQVHKLQTSLDSTVNANDKLKGDIQEKSAVVSACTVELEKLGVRYESVMSELDEVKKQLKIADKTASDAEKMVAKLEGKLDVYKSLDKDK